MYMDPDVQMQQQDMVVCVICDGFEQIKQGFKDYATEHKFFDIEKLKSRGFMEEDRDGKWKMKTMQDLMDKSVPESEEIDV